MRGALSILLCCAVLTACVTARRVPAPKAVGWQQRVAELQKLDAWRLDGRAAVAVGTQGWQATLNWRQHGDSAEVHLSGPLGIGALVLKRSVDGLSLNGAPPSDAELAQLQERLGFELPIDHLRFWLLGVPDPSAAFELKRNDQDRGSQLIQSDWTIDIDRYMPLQGDFLPAHLVLSREGVRVRIAIDHWELR
ncbi:MAG TPA: lipoprotein insertase outer membrane protein LolB [Steroidobacteraceae bacterium]|jgi:outer membrane lipoprotein LolB|nr:lipoprotein insertase outer membrane protein LolB [Steroidobacteraceae bacterium]